MPTILARGRYQVNWLYLIPADADVTASFNNAPVRPTCLATARLFSNAQTAIGAEVASLRRQLLKADDCCCTLRQTTQPFPEERTGPRPGDAVPDSRRKPATRPRYQQLNTTACAGRRDTQITSIRRRLPSVSAPRHILPVRRCSSVLHLPSAARSLAIAAAGAVGYSTGAWLWLVPATQI